jgi:hypothetical protein
MGKENVRGKLVIDIREHYYFRIVTTIMDWSDEEEYA